MHKDAQMSTCFANRITEDMGFQLSDNVCDENYHMTIYCSPRYFHPVKYTMTFYLVGKKNETVRCSGKWLALESG